MTSRLLDKDRFIRAFLKAWNDVYPTARARIDKAYESDKKWTDVMLGEALETLGGKSLLARTIEALDLLPCGRVEFDPERHKVDVFGRVRLKTRRAPHAGYLNVLMIEVENNTADAYQEFWKLLQSRCALRVLITYELTRPEVHRKALETCAEMYRDADQYIKDDPDAYLVLMGTRSAEFPKSIQWKFYELRNDNFCEYDVARSRAIEAAPG